MTVSAIGFEKDLGLLGAVDGDVEELIDALAFFASERVKVVIQLGDFGWVSADDGRRSELDVVDRVLDDHEMLLFFIDGEKDDLAAPAQLPGAASDVRWLTGLIGYLPRGSRGRLIGDHTLAAMGGAGDPEQTGADEAAWNQLHAPTADDLERLGWGHADVLLGHEAPLDVLALDRQLANEPATSPAAKASMALGRGMFDQAVDQITPQLAVSAHYRSFFDETVGRVDAPGHGYATRAVGLAACANVGISRAILHAGTLALSYYNHAGSPVGVSKQVTDLLEVHGGRWRVDTQGSSHVVDLDRMTVERRPGPASERTINDGVRALRTFERCQIGRSGYWTMRTADPAMEFSWHRTSVIRHIEEFPDE